MTTYAILWVDNRHAPHLRAFAGTHDEAQQACEALRSKYEHGEGFHSARVALLDSEAGTLASVLAETKEDER